MKLEYQMEFLIPKFHTDWYLSLVDSATTYSTQAHEARVPNGILIPKCHTNWYPSLVDSGTTYNTQAHEAWVPSGIFKPPDAMSSCHGGKENKELEFSELEY